MEHFVLKMVLVIVFVQLSLEKKMVFYFTNWKMDYNPKLANVTMDLSLYKNNSRQNPSQEFPGLQAWFYQDISYLEYHWLRFEPETNEIRFNQTLKICDGTKQRSDNMFLRALFNMFEKQLKQNIQCPIVKGFHESKRFTVPSFFIPSFVKSGFKVTQNMTLKTKIMNKFVSILRITCDQEFIEIED